MSSERRILMTDLPETRPPERIVDTAYRAIRGAILDRRLEPGEQLSVPELSRRLGFSRSPVREAVSQLVAEGLAREEPRKGASVARLGPETLFEIHEVREPLEGLAARMCALRVGSEGLSELGRILDRQAEAVAEGDGDAYWETDREFHERLARSCGNGRLERFLGSLHAQMRVALRIVAQSPEHIEQGHGEHRAILGVIEDRSPEKAEELMRAHIAGTRARLRETMEPDDQPATPKGVQTDL